MSAAPAIREKHEGAPGDRLSVRIWLRLLSCTMAIEKTVQRRLGEQFATTLPRFDVMAALERRPGGVTMSELSRLLLVSNGNVTAVVRKLAEDGLVTTAALPSDRRASVVQLTARGRGHFAELAAAHRDWVEGLLAGLGSEERNALYNALGALKLSLGQAAQEQAK